ncbi:phosphoribosylformylglycinamidine synthase subunit PurS [Hydrogenivirga sp. 128-5-R1-1]|uniref:phosphoribosylformylglycinamidine synthase subunit PurS n=1 Tax=Hydrogenivirga sp. 128-5-R1-1 TaxID=392423 RepID=UPI00015EF9BF|nr:phosphoribosylformylglycinamidine synthase subunit PurS [Hydrogenivirga sp. 128-5-R1-1]EDP75242.1 Phosphoribosylformylglycinamidine (FGAM) synthase, PurS component [Hydrogenivirga sp. 128-5-R1-1]
MKKVRVLITPKEGLLDPQGRAVEEMLKDNGFKVRHVKVGKLVEMEVEEGEKVKEIVEKFILNPLIEDYEIEEL